MGGNAGCADDDDLLGTVGQAVEAEIEVPPNNENVQAPTSTGTALFLPWLTQTRRFVTVVSSFDTQTQEDDIIETRFVYPTPTFRVRLVPDGLTRPTGWVKVIIESENARPIALSNMQVIINSGDTMTMPAQTIDNGGSALALPAQEAVEDEFADVTFGAGTLAASGTFHREIWFRAIAPEAGVVTVTISSNQVRPQTAQASIEISPCGGDFNGSGGVGVQDLFDFLAAFFAQLGRTGPGLSADVTGNLVVSVQDLFAFLGMFFEECEP